MDQIQRDLELSRLLREHSDELIKHQIDLMKKSQKLIEELQEPREDYRLKPSKIHDFSKRVSQLIEDARAKIIEIETTSFNFKLQTNE